MSLDLSLRDQALKVTGHFDRRDDGGAFNLVGGFAWPSSFA
jgi:hypothetical protein